MKSFPKLIFQTREEAYFISPEEIVRVLGDGSYSHLYLLSGKRITLSKNLGQLIFKLPPPLFFRTHQSHLINLLHIQKLHKTQGDVIYMADGGEVPLSRSRKEDFFEMIQQRA